MKIQCAIIVLMLLQAVRVVDAQTTATRNSSSSPTLESRYASADPALSADPNSNFWKDSRGVTLERSITSGDVLPNLRSEVRSRWSDKNLYILFVAHYETLHTKPDTVTTTETYGMWNWDVFEAYVGSDFDHINRYWELMVSPNAEYLDQAIDSTVARPGLNRERDANTGMKVKASIDADKKIWVGEMQIPWAAIDKRTPKAGNALRVNFFRQDGATQGRRGATPGTRSGAGASSATLTRAGAPGGPGAAGGNPNVRGGRTFQAWQPTGVWAPHHPEKFGLLKLTAN
jgi:hypothetical protein